MCLSESAKEEKERENLSKQGLIYAKEKKQLVDGILKTLRESGSNILESDDLVNKLDQSKQMTQDISKKLDYAKSIGNKIEENRKIFQPVAEHGVRLYFAVQDLPLLDPMYQFSMKWFKDLFTSCFYTGEETKKEEEEDVTGSFVNDDSTPGSKPKRQVRKGDQKKLNDREPAKTKEMKMARVI